MRNAVLRRLFHSLPALVRARLNTLDPQAHQYDATPMDNLALRVLRPRWAGLPPPRVITGSRDPEAVMLHALPAAVRTLRQRYGNDTASWRRAHAVTDIESLTGVIGPTAHEPFEDRGTWVQHVAFTPRSP